MMADAELERMAGAARVTGDIGESLADALKTAQNVVEQLAGGKRALRESAAKIGESIGAHITKTFDDGAFKGLDEHAIRDLLNEYLRRVCTAMANLSEKWALDSIAAAGKVAALRASVDLVQRHHTTACARQKQLLAPPEEPPDDGIPRTRTGHPKLSHRGPDGLPMASGEVVVNGSPPKKKRARKATKKRAAK